MKKINLILFVAVLVVPVGSRALTLDEVVKAVRSHPSIEAARWEARGVKSQKHAEAWLPDPKIGVIVDEIPLSKKSLGNAAMTTWQVSQMIPFPGTLVSKSHALEAEYRAKLAMTSGVERDRILDAKKTYFELIANQNLLSSQQAIIGSLSQMVVSGSRAYATKTDSMAAPESEAGGEPKSAKVSGFGDILMAKMKKAEAEARLHDLHHQNEALQNQLNLLMGRTPDAPLGPLVVPGLKKLKLSGDVLEKKLETQNADLTALQWMVKKSQRDVTTARLSKIPTVEPMFGYEQRQNMENSYMAGLSLNFPLWINRNQAETNMAKAEREKTRLDYESKMRSTKSDFYNLINNVIWHRQIVNQYHDEIVPLAKSAVAAGQEGYAANLEPAFSMLQKVVNLEQAQSMYWNMWLDYQTTYALLEQMVGEEL